MTLVLQWHLWQKMWGCISLSYKIVQDGLAGSEIYYGHIYGIWETTPHIRPPRLLKGLKEMVRWWWFRAGGCRAFTLLSLKYITYECASMHWINDPVTDVTMMVYTIIIKTSNCVHFCTKMTLHFNSIPHTLPVVILNTNENVKEGEKRIQIHSLLPLHL